MNWQGFTHAALRIVAGLLFLQHPVQSMLGYGFAPFELMSQSGVGGIIELVGSVLIVIGFQTRWAAFICSGTMAVAFWQYHVIGSWAEQGSAAFVPILNRGELAFLYCFVFLFLWAHGGGPFSVDARRGK
jgi:putative oxidoreductase